MEYNENIKLLIKYGVARLNNIAFDSNLTLEEKRIGEQGLKILEKENSYARNMYSALNNQVGGGE